MCGHESVFGAGGRGEASDCRVNAETFAEAGGQRRKSTIRAGKDEFLELCHHEPAGFYPYGEDGRKNRCGFMALYARGADVSEVDDRLVRPFPEKRESLDVEANWQCEGRSNGGCLADGSVCVWRSVLFRAGRQFEAYP